MIDASLDKPFFKRDANKAIVGMETTAGWHNESSNGLMMIGEHYEKEFNYDEQMDKFSL